MSSGPQPLFFTDPQIVSVERHAVARIRTDLGFKFAADTNAVPLTVADIPEAAKFYPLAFSVDAAPLPVAVMGFKGRNAFVGSNHEWLPHHYVPSYVRKYPFLFAENTATGALTLCVDSPALASDSGMAGPALYESGTPTAFAQQVLEFCASYQQAYIATRQLCETLARLQLLTPRVVTMKLPDGSENRLDGIALLDEEKFAALASRDIVFLHQQNSLATIHYILQSQSNWRRLAELASAA